MVIRARPQKAACPRGGVLLELHARGAARLVSGILMGRSTRRAACSPRSLLDVRRAHEVAVASAEFALGAPEDNFVSQCKELVALLQAPCGTATSTA